MKKENLAYLLVGIGVIALGSAFLVNDGFLKEYLGNIHYVQLVTIGFCPVMGLLGLYFSIKSKTLLTTILSVLLILAYPITWFLVEWLVHGAFF